MNSAQAIELFLEMMSAERGASDNTLSAYKRDLEDWAHLVAKAKRDLLSVGTGSLEAVLAAWANRGLRRLQLPENYQLSSSFVSFFKPKACGQIIQPIAYEALNKDGLCPRFCRKQMLMLYSNLRKKMGLQLSLIHI